MKKLLLIITLLGASAPSFAEAYSCRAKVYQCSISNYNRCTLVRESEFEAEDDYSGSYVFGYDRTPARYYVNLTTCTLQGNEQQETPERN